MTSEKATNLLDQIDTAAFNFYAAVSQVIQESHTDTNAKNIVAVIRAHETSVLRLRYLEMIGDHFITNKFMISLSSLVKSF